MWKIVRQTRAGQRSTQRTKARKRKRVSTIDVKRGIEDDHRTGDGVVARPAHLSVGLRSMRLAISRRNLLFSDQVRTERFAISVLPSLRDEGGDRYGTNKLTRAPVPVPVCGRGRLVLGGVVRCVLEVVGDVVSGMNLEGRDVSQVGPTSFTFTFSLSLSLCRQGSEREVERFGSFLRPSDVREKLTASRSGARIDVSGVNAGPQDHRTTGPLSPIICTTASLQKVRRRPRQEQ